MPSEVPRNTQFTRSTGFCSLPSALMRATDKFWVADVTEGAGAGGSAAFTPTDAVIRDARANAAMVVFMKVPPGSEWQRLLSSPPEFRAVRRMRCLERWSPAVARRIRGSGRQIGRAHV